MLNGNNDSLLNYYYNRGPEIGLYDNHLTIRSIKLYADGALGSRGAWLIEDYHDAEGEHGHIVTPVETLKKVTEERLGMDVTRRGFFAHARSTAQHDAAV